MVCNFTKIIIKNNVRIYLSDLTDVVNQVFNYHHYLPLPNLILANAIVAFTPLKFLYDTNHLMVRLKSNGAIKLIIFESKNDNIRCLISNPNIETEYDQKNYNDIPIILGIGDDGSLEVSREVQGQLFKSETKLAKFDIVTDLAYFLNKSDQIYSAVYNDIKLDVKNPNIATRAINVIFQLLPDHNEEDKVWIENLFKNKKLNNQPLAEIEKLINGKVLEIKQVDGSCWCDKEKIISAIKLLSQNEIEQLFKDHQPIEVVCEFCQTKHLINEDELK